ncbi:MAG: hypothetical protein ACOYON_12245 [Fimbriimonas sp.]
MARQAIERCPDDVWTSGVFPRSYWRIAYHALAYAHLYLYPNLESWQSWPKHRQECTWLEGDDIPVMEPYSRAELIEFVDLIVSEVGPRIDALDLTEEWCGYKWYPQVSRLELLVLSLRHLHGHLGQLSEILISHGLDIDWLGPAPESP